MVQDPVKAYFETTAAAYQDACTQLTDVRSFIFQERKRVVCELFTVSRGMVLDVGCGPAVYTEQLARPDRRVYGVDVAEEMVRRAAKKGCANAAFLAGTIQQLPFADGVFDGVLCVGVLEYLNDLDAAVHELARVTKPGGIVLVTVPNGSSLLNRVDMALRSVVRFGSERVGLRGLRRLMDHTYTARAIPTARLISLLSSHGLVVEVQRHHVFRLAWLHALSPPLALRTAQRMNFVSSRWLGVNTVVRARRA